MIIIRNKFAPVLVNTAVLTHHFKYWTIKLLFDQLTVAIKGKGNRKEQISKSKLQRKTRIISSSL